MIDEETPETISDVISSVDEETPLLDKESPFASQTPRTPTPNSHPVLNPPKTRKRAQTEHQEIWDELEHDTLSPISPFSARHVNIRSTSNPSSKRTSRLDLPEPTGEENGPEPTETTELLARSGTGRSYRDYKRRRSMPGSEGRASRKRSVSSQTALRGWLKSKLGKGRSSDKGKDPEDGQHPD